MAPAKKIWPGTFQDHEDDVAEISRSKLRDLRIKSILTLVLPTNKMEKYL